MTPEEEKQKKDQDGRLITVLAGGIIIAVAGARLIAAYFFDAEVTGSTRRYGEVNADLYWLFLVIGILVTGLGLWSYLKNKK